MISRIIAAYRQRKAMERPQVAPNPQDEAEERLAQLVRQTLASPDHIVWKARRAAALKGRKVGA
jgi:hypothetical protein